MKYYLGVTKNDDVIHIVVYTYPLYKALCGKHATPNFNVSYNESMFDNILNHCEVCLAQKDAKKERDSQNERHFL